MTRDDVIRMAREAGWTEYSLLHSVEVQRLERFANLVAAAERRSLSSQDNLPKLPTGMYICHVCNRQEMVRAKFDEESG